LNQEEPNGGRATDRAGAEPFAPYGVLATFGWTALAFALYVVLAVIYVWSGSESYIFSAACTSAGSLAAVLVVVLAARRTGLAVTDYIALKRPRGRTIALGIAAQMALVLAFYAPILTAWAGSGHPPQIAIRIDAADLAGLGLWFWLVAIVPIPAVCEEIVFRGFMYRGLAKSDTEAFFAIMATSAVFAMVHQDGGSLLIWHFIHGVLFGLLRWRTGTIWAPISAHLFNNAVGFTLTTLIAIR
jgi:CAAX protease family protein